MIFVKVCSRGLFYMERIMIRSMPSVTPFYWDGFEPPMKVSKRRLDWIFKGALLGKREQPFSRRGLHFLHKK